MTFLPDLPTFLAFSLAALVLTITPGPDMTLFLGRTLSEGRAAGMAAMLGASCGVVVHTSLAAFGLSALIAASPEAFLVLKICGGGYLIYLAFQAIMNGSTLNLDRRSTRSHSLLSNWLTGVGINLLNPKVILFFVTFLPQFVSAGDPHAVGKLFFLGLYFMAVAIPLSIAMILAADRFAAALKRRPKIMRGLDWLFASVFSAFAVRIFLTHGR
ncbi:LysE family translocator [Mangrovibrevibacter kandeliae]|uniref:LysE family translocator n=1 Tax=Mangrovibrevibacter kandeliae TaxID=2968473 RepID=UPI0021189E49|nr:MULTISPECIES: LysE family translocator [unclassified Aurantimonas]MCQ8781913.1 LysE family translocator [Aurantimonas sp. CSK15Z-1]MCW4115430.1 LysE family translocator [Aurantimonas sp. MSK8Z-1]